MRLSEKLDAVITMEAAGSYGMAKAEALLILRDHGKAIRQALRDSERLAAAPICVVNVVHTFAEAGDLIGIDSPYETGMSVGQRVRLVIEDAAMGRPKDPDNG